MSSVSMQEQDDTCVSYIKHYALNVKVKDKDIIFKGNTICPCWPCRTSILSLILF